MMKQTFRARIDRIERRETGTSYVVLATLPGDGDDESNAAQRNRHAAPTAEEWEAKIERAAREAAGK